MIVEAFKFKYENKFGKMVNRERNVKFNRQATLTANAKMADALKLTADAK